MVARVLFATLVVCVAVDAAAQSHEPSAAAARPAPTVSKEAADDHAPATTARPAHEPAPPPRRPAPVVSRVTGPPKAAANPGGGHGEANDHAEAAPAAPQGYVAIGASRRSPASNHAAAPDAHPAGKPRPLVSGAAELKAETSAAPAGDHAEPAADDPPADAAHAMHAAALPASPSPAAPGDSGVAADRKPTKLSEIHLRLAAALADARKSGNAATPAAESAGHAAAPPQKPAAGSAAGGGDIGGPGAAVPRVTLTWPAPRWLLRWPASDRHSMSRPGVAPAITPVRDQPE